MSGSAGEVDLLRSFSDLLQSSARITLPDETLYGAITHFLTSLDGAALSSFSSLTITSPELWSQGNRARHVREAVKVAVLAKASALEKEYEKAFFRDYRRDKHARKWMNTIARSVIGAGAGSARRTVLLGLVEGMKGASVIWGEVQEEVEEELVVEATTLPETEVGLQELSSVILSVAEQRLWALNLSGTLPQLQQRTSETTPGDQLDSLVVPRALGRLYKIMDKGEDAYRRQAWSAIESFCADDAHENRASQEYMTADSRRRIYLTVARDIVDILLSSRPPSTASTLHDTACPSVRISSTILRRLFTIARRQSSSMTSDEAYTHVVNGCLDVIEARGGQTGTRDLLRGMVSQPDRLHPEQVAFVLGIAEQMVHLLDAGSIRDTVLPLCQDYLRDPQHRSSFEAAHEFMIALVKAFIQAQSHEDQLSFMAELIPAYAKILLRLFLDGDITSDQLLSAYTMVSDGAAHCDDSVFAICADLVDDKLSRVSTDRGKTQSLRLVRIATAPFVPQSEIKAHLDKIAWRILDTEFGSKDRTDLVKAAFGMVIKDLPDGAKGDGIDWWFKWKGVFDGEEEGRERAKL